MLVREAVWLVTGDISPDFDAAIRSTRRVAWDIETSGLNWQDDRIGTCQLHVPEVGTEIVRIDQGIPNRLRELLMSERVLKVFHHAPFDLRFMRHHWNAAPRNVACTKILSKLLNPQLESREHSLKPLLARYLDVQIDKTQRVSDWFRRQLSDEQLSYAANDVKYLIPLLDQLLEEARAAGLADVAEASFSYLPSRVESDLRGCGDIFAY